MGVVAMQKRCLEGSYSMIVLNQAAKQQMVAMQDVLTVLQESY